MVLQGNQERVHSTHAPGPAPPFFLTLDNRNRLPTQVKTRTPRSWGSLEAPAPTSLTLRTAWGHSPETSSARRPARPAQAWACWPGSLARSSSTPQPLRRRVESARECSARTWIRHAHPYPANTMDRPAALTRAQGEGQARTPPPLAEWKPSHRKEPSLPSPSPTEAAQWARLSLPAGTPRDLSGPAQGGGAGETTKHAWRGVEGRRGRDNPGLSGRGSVPEKPTRSRDNLAHFLGGGNHLLQGQKTPEQTTYGGVCNPFTWEREWTGSFSDPRRG